MTVLYFRVLLQVYHTQLINTTIKNKFYSICVIYTFIMDMYVLLTVLQYDTLPTKLVT